MRKLYERAMDNLEVSGPDKKFLTAYGDDAIDPVYLHLGYIGFIERKLEGLRPGELTELIALGIDCVEKVVNVFLHTEKPGYKDLVDLRFILATLSEPKLTNFVITDKYTASSFSKCLWRLRVQLEAYVQNKELKQATLSFNYIRAANTLIDAKIVWRAAEARLLEIRKEYKKLASDDLFVV